MSSAQSTLLRSQTVAQACEAPRAKAQVHAQQDISQAGKNSQPQSINHQQSFEMVQTLLLSSIGTLAYLRNLLPTDCFKKRDYPVVHTAPHVPYKSLTDNSEHTPNSAKSKKPWQLMVLVRGKNSAADKILNWLDGIFEAISKRVLAAVQLSVIVDRERPSDVIEMYRYSFNYAEDGIANMVFSGLHGKPITVASARSDFAKIVRNLITLNITLPELPDTRFLNAHLFYTEDCPRDYEPVCFQSCSNHDIYVPHNELWQMQDFGLGSMDSGYHSVGLDVGHLVLVGNDDFPGDAVMVPPDLRYEKSVSMIDWMVKDGTLNLKTPQESIITDTRDSLVAESQTAPSTDSLIPTQVLPARSFTQHECSTEWVLNTQRYSELIETKDKVSSHCPNSGLMMGKDEVRCECTHNQEEGSMVRCDICDYWQHHHCYGFQIKKPKETHVCYRCLIVESDQPRLRDLTDLAQFRRALWLLYGQDRGLSQHYPKSQTAYGKLLGDNLESNKTITQRLREEGFLTRPKAKFKAIDTVEQLELMEGRYFDPMTLIEHYYEPRPLAHSELPLDLPAQGTAIISEENTSLQYAKSREPSPPATSEAETHTEELVHISPGPRLIRNPMSQSQPRLQNSSPAERTSPPMLPNRTPRTSARNPSGPQRLTLTGPVAVRSSPRINAMKHKRAEESTPWRKRVKSSHATSPMDASNFESPN